MNSRLVSIIVLVLLLPTFALAFSTLGLSKVDLVSNDATIGGPAWLLTVVENGNNQHAEGTFTPSDLKDTDGSTTKNTIKLEIDNTKNVCAYSFQNSYTSIQTMDLRDAPSSTLSPSWLNTETKCKAITGYRSWYVFNGYGYCLISSTIGKVTPLSTPVNQISSDVKATVGTETVSGTVTNTAQRSVNLGTRAYAGWEGNLVSGQSCPNPLDTGVMGAQVNANFYVTNKAAYDQYDPLARDLSSCFASVYANTIVSYDGMIACVNQYNNRANAVTLKTSIQPFAGAAIQAGSASTPTTANVGLPNLLQYPVITFRVRADWLGIVIPVGKPSITSLTATPFTEATNGNIRGVIKNIGTGKGSFSISATCDAPITQAGVAQVLTLDPGTSDYVDIKVTGQATGSTRTATCTVTAQDINQPSNTASKTVSVTVNPIALCQANQLRCSQQTIQECNQQGTAWIDSQTCLNGCTTQNGQPVCQNAEVCSADSQCDDHNPETVDSCVGVVQKTCLHKVIPLDDSFLAKYGTVLLIVGGIATLVFLNRKKVFK